MNWFAISGSWRHTTSDVERDVRVAVNAIMRRGDGIVTDDAYSISVYWPLLKSLYTVRGALCLL